MCTLSGVCWEMTLFASKITCSFCLLLQSVFLLSISQRQREIGERGVGGREQREKKEMEERRGKILRERDVCNLLPFLLDVALR